MRTRRAQAPFVVVNAPAITPDGMESELFRVEPGLTVATGRRARRGAHGTLYLDEVADMPSETQAKIFACWSIRASSVGDHPVQVDVRVISSTSRDLAQAITDGHSAKTVSPPFGRADSLASLAERREDIPP